MSEYHSLSRPSAFLDFNVNKAMQYLYHLNVNTGYFSYSHFHPQTPLDCCDRVPRAVQGVLDSVTRNPRTDGAASSAAELQVVQWFVQVH